MPFTRCLVPPAALASLVVAGALLSGCQQGEVVVARVNNSVITEPEYAERTQRITSQDIQQSQAADAGAAAMIAMVRERLVDEVAAEKHVTPSDQEVAAFYATLKKLNPKAGDAIANKVTSEEQFIRQVRTQMEQFRLGTNGARADDKAVQDLYDKEKARLKVPEYITVRLLPVMSMDAGIAAIEQLRRSGDFKAVAASMPGGNATMAASAGQQQTIAAADPQIPKSVSLAFAALAPGAYTPEPIEMRAPGSPATAPASYLVGQLVERYPAHTLTFEEIRPLLEQQSISQTQPMWQMHTDAVVSDFAKELMNKGRIEINITRYQPLLQQIVTPVASLPTAPPPSSTPRAPAPRQRGAAPRPGVQQP